MVHDPEVRRLQIQEGKLDYVTALRRPHPRRHVRIQADRARSNLQVLFWDGGSGTGSMFFFNYDHKDPKMRALIREPKFRQALSHAVKRDETQKQVYFKTGELSTGTMQPEGDRVPGQRPGQADLPAVAGLLRRVRPREGEEAPRRDRRRRQDGDGKRELPDGGELKIRLDYPADTTQDHEKNSLLKRDWEAIGITTTQNPVPPDAFGDQWDAGALATQTAWEVGNGPDHLAQAAWLVPIEPTRWAPLEGQFFNVRGTPAETAQRDVDPFERTPPRMEPDPDGPIAAMWKLYDQSKLEPDEITRRQLAWELVKIHIKDGPFFMGTVANTPQLVLVHKDLRNVPRKENLALGGFVNPWQHPTPAVYDPETYFWANPDDHA